jgi:hypothetical protein
MKISAFLRSVASVAVGLSLSGAALATDLASMPTKAIVAPAPISSPWTFTATPYAWAMMMNGSVTVKGRTGDINVDLNDLWNIVKQSEIPKDLAAFMGSFEARYDRFSIFSDLVYLKATLSGDMVRARGNNFVNAALNASANFQDQMVIAEMAATYQVAHWGSNATADSGTAIDFLGGARYWWMEGKLSATASAVLNISDLTLSGGRAIAKSPSVDWVDPLVGVRLRHQFVPGLNLTVSGDVGGFDVGSRLSWQALAALNYDFYKSKSVVWSGMAGYRGLYVDYSKGSGPTLFEYDMTLHGPILGVTARF